MGGHVSGAPKLQALRVGHAEWLAKVGGKPLDGPKVLNGRHATLVRSVQLG